MTQFGLQYFEARGAETAAATKAVGCQVARVQLFTDHDDAAIVSNKKSEEIINEVLSAGMEPHVIVRTAKQIRQQIPPKVWVDFYNEPDLEQYNMPLEMFLERLPAVIKACKKRNPLAIGGVANLDRRGMAFLSAIPWKTIPEWVAAEHHWYPDDGRPHESHIENYFFERGKGLHLTRRNTRDQDVIDLKALVGEDRELICSETGWWRRPAWTDPTTGETVPERTAEEVATWYAVERPHYIKHRYRKAIAYQIDSEPPPPEGVRWEPQHGYGFREVGSVDAWLPSAAAWFGEQQ